MPTPVEMEYERLGQFFSTYRPMRTMMLLKQMEYGMQQEREAQMLRERAQKVDEERLRLSAEELADNKAYRDRAYQLELDKFGEDKRQFDATLGLNMLKAKNDADKDSSADYLKLMGYKLDAARLQFDMDKHLGESLDKETKNLLTMYNTSVDELSSLYARAYNSDLNVSKEDRAKAKADIAKKQLDVDNIRQRLSGKLDLMPSETTPSSTPFNDDFNRKQREARDYNIANAVRHINNAKQLLSIPMSPDPNETNPQIIAIQKQVLTDARLQRSRFAQQLDKIYKEYEKQLETNPYATLDAEAINTVLLKYRISLAKIKAQNPYVANLIDIDKLDEYLYPSQPSMRP